MLRDYFQRIFNNYQRAKNGNFSGSPMAKMITEELPEYLKEIIIDSDDYIFKGNAGKGNWTESPYIAILDSKVTTGVGSGYYVIYIFSKDTNRLYLSLNQEILKSNSLTPQEYLKDLSLKASEFRKKIGDIPDKFNLETLSLGNPTFYSRYEIGNICAKEYSIEDLPSEDELEADLKIILGLYEKLKHLETGPMGIRDFLKKMLENYIKAKNNPKIAKELVSFANGGEFHQYLIKIANLSKKGDYGTFGLFGSTNHLSLIPYVHIYNKKYPTWRIIFLFREDMKGVYLSIGQQPFNLEGRLKEEGLNIQKFSQEFNDYLLNDSIEARTKLKNLTTIPEEYLEKIDLGSEKAHSAASREAGNVFAKYYTLENLPSEEELISDFKEILKLYDELANESPRIWSISPGSISRGEQTKLWPLYKQRGFIGIGWLHDSHSYLEFGNIDELKEALIEFHPNYKKTDPTQAANMVWDFAHNIKKGDIVVANSGFSKIRGIGIVTSDYIDPSNPENPGIFDYFWHLRKINWKITDELELNQNIFIRNTLAELNENKWNDIKKAYIKKDPKYADIFNQIENGESVESINIKENLELIFNKLPIAKSRNETVAGHEIGEAFLNISEAIYKVAKSIHPEKEYHSHAHYQNRGNWYNLFYVYIQNKAHKNIMGSWDQHNVIFRFSKDLNGVYLVLSQEREYAKNFLKSKLREYNEDEITKYRNHHVAQIKKQLLEFNEISDSLIEESTKLTSLGEYAIYGKYYDKNNLPSNDEIIADFKELLNLYSQLEPDTGEYTDFKIIEDKMEIKESQNKLESIFKQNAQRNDDISYSSDLGIWMSSGQNPNSFYNLLGVGKPNLNSPNETTIEINIPFKGINRNISGAFARDNSGKTFLLHRGNLGGKYGGKSLLEENYDGWVNVEDGGTINKFILIGALDEPDFPEKLKEFVFEVCKIKKGAECVENQNFFDYLSEKGYLFDQKLVENFLLSLKVKPFVILTGNSGTGKTKVAQLFAEYLNQQVTINPQLEYGDIFSKEVDITTNSKNLRGNWELKTDEFKKLQDFQENLTLEVHRGRSNTKKTGKGYIKNNRLYYDDNTPFFDEISKIIVGSRAKIQVIAKEYQESPSKTKHEIVPVGANWTENRHVVGFYNVITGNYQKTQTLDLILKANKENNEFEKLSDPYFLILDEMNLSHVERYFSDFLSVMESQEKMPLHDNRSEEVPQKLKLPANLQVIGTVNVDETTYMFSPKVLDRANTIEFLTLNPLKFMQKKSKDEKPSGDILYLENTLSDIKARNYSIDELQDKMKSIKTKNNQVLWNVLSKEIDDIYNELKKAGFDFGFRVVNEIMRFMYVAWKYEGKQAQWENWERYFDAQIKQKMLPKLHGSQRTLQEPIKSLFKICYGKPTNQDPRLITLEQLKAANYPTAALKLSEMDKVLYEQRYVAFIN